MRINAEQIVSIKVNKKERDVEFLYVKYKKGNWFRREVKGGFYHYVFGYCGDKFRKDVFSEDDKVYRKDNVRITMSDGSEFVKYFDSEFEAKRFASDLENKGKYITI